MFNSYYDGFNQIENYRNELKEAENELNTLDLSKVDEVVNQIEIYKTYLDKYVPELNIFKFLVIDLNYSEIKYNESSYNLNNSMD